MSTLVHRAHWCACLPALPLVALQGRQMRARTVALPEAGGDRSGVEVGDLPALSLLVLGESTAVGVGARTQREGLAGSAASSLARESGRQVTWRIIGKSGATASWVLANLEASQQAPEAALVVLGVNDTLRLTSERRWSSAIAGIARVLAARGCKQVVFSKVPPLGDFEALPGTLRYVLGVRARLLDGALKRTLAHLDAPVVHANVEFPATPGFMAQDGFHPSEAGYAEWGRQLARAIIRHAKP